jgi:hypothetical protein
MHTWGIAYGECRLALFSKMAKSVEVFVHQQLATFLFEKVRFPQVFG